MSLSYMIYLTTILERIHTATIVISWFSFIGGGFCLLRGLVEKDNYVFGISKPILLVAVIVSVIAMFLPPQECVYASYITNHPTLNMFWNKFVCYLTGNIW